MQMTHTELSRLCRLVFAAVADWLDRQDETTQFIHRVVVESVQIGGGAPLDCVLHLVELESPEEWLDYDKNTLPMLVYEFLRREFHELSDLFTVFYKEFNERFFHGSLPACRVIVFHDVPLPSMIRDRSDVCRNEIGTGWLKLVYNGWPECMITQLVHRMAHISSEADHGSAWEREMSRLRRSGAPMYEEVERIARMGWTNISASPWLLC